MPMGCLCPWWRALLYQVLGDGGDGTLGDGFVDCILGDGDGSVDGTLGDRFACDGDGSDGSVSDTLGGVLGSSVRRVLRFSTAVVILWV